MDGKKRAGFLAIGLFLAINGLWLAASQMDAIRTIFAFAAGELDERGLSVWTHASNVPRIR